MKIKIYAALLSFIFCHAGLFAQFPDLNSLNANSAGSCTFKYHCTWWEEQFENCDTEQGKQKCEVPPWIIPGGWRQYIMVNGEGSFANSTPLSIITNNVIDIRTSGYGPFDLSHSETHQQNGHCPVNNNRPWARNYNCMYAAEVIENSAAGRISFGVMTGENKNACAYDPNTLAIHCPSSINPIQHGDCDEHWESMNSFVMGAWIPNTAATDWGNTYFSNEMGPIVWPAAGYLHPSGAKASAGVGNPSSIQWGGYLYVYYNDEGPFSGTPEEGRTGGIKVARAPLGEVTNPNAWQTYYRDPVLGDTWNPSLPAGFTKENMMAFLSSKGPKSTDLMEDQRYSEIRFSVAHVNGTNYFIGVESYQGDGFVEKALRLSTDLVHWSERIRVIEHASDWTQSLLNYPIFLSADGWSNTHVDPNDFYVIGTQGSGSGIGSTVYRKHIYWTDPNSGGGGGGGGEGGCCNGGSGTCCIPCNTPPCEGIEPTRRSTTTQNMEPELARAAGISPNPGNGLFKVSYTLNSYAKTQLSVLDISGRRIQTGHVQARAAGSYVDNVDITSHAKGVYMVELLVNGKRTVYKVIKN
jgi:hypothetical protein